MKRLMEQILKFGMVGVFCFGIDFAIILCVSAVLRNTGMGTSAAALIGAFFGFTVSVIINYLLSMKYVFVRREELDRRKEFVIFTILSLVGLGINELLIKVSIDVIFVHIKALSKLLSPGMATTVAKMIATGVVMVYNFVTRKIFLEKKS